MQNIHFKKMSIYVICYDLFISSGFVQARGRSDIHDVNINSENWAVVKAALLTGTYPKLAHINQESCSISSGNQTQISFHLTSVLSQPHYKKVIADVPSY